MAGDALTRVLLGTGAVKGLLLGAGAVKRDLMRRAPCAHCCNGKPLAATPRSGRHAT